MERKFVAKIIEGGRVTVPQRVRELEDLEKGDYVKLRYVGKVWEDKEE